jgi:hypothetical protein
MGKLNRAPLEIVEEWTPIEPSDTQSLLEEGKKLKFVISLLLKARDRALWEQSERSEKENKCIRRKAGLSV